MSLDNQFTLPADISLGRAMVAAMSIGWQPAIHIDFKADRDNPSSRILFSLKHGTWHGTLCEVTASVIQLNLSLTDLTHQSALDVENTLRDALVKRLPELQKLWQDYPDTVPCQLMDGSWVVSDYETKHFHQYKNNERRVVWPERMNPVWLLPGWPNRDTIVEYAENKDYIPPGFIADFIMKMSSLKINSMAHINTYPGTYRGDFAVPAKWTVSLFGYSLRTEMKMDYTGNRRNDTVSQNPTAQEVIEFGNATDVTGMFTRSFDIFEPIALDIIAGRESKYVKRRPHARPAKDE